MRVPIGHIIEIALLGSPDGALRSNRPHGQTLPITRDDALSPRIAAFDGRRLKLGQRWGVVVSKCDAAACRNSCMPRGITDVPSMPPSDARRALDGISRTLGPIGRPLEGMLGSVRRFGLM